MTTSTSLATVIVSILLAALFGFASSIKLLGVRQSLEVRDHLGISATNWRGIGLLELAHARLTITSKSGRRPARLGYAPMANGYP